MSKAFWPSAKVSIILLPSGEQGRKLFEFAKSWVEAGLLGPAMWVLPESVVSEKDAPPRVMATVLGSSADRTVIEIEVDLFEQIAREALRVIRLVKLRSARPSKEFDLEQDEIVRIIERYLGWSVPSPDKRLSDRDSVLDYQPINLICAPTEFKATVQDNWSRMGYGASVIAAPEDRSSPWSSDAFVRDDAKFDGFTLMHLATVSGIWNGLPVGTLELFEREQSGRSQVWLSRVFFSGVFTDGLARRIAAGFVEDLADPEYELSDAPDGTVFIDPMYEDAYVDVMVEASFLLDESALEYRRPELPGDPDKVKIGILQQLAHYFVFAGRRFSRLPYWLWMWIKRRVASRLQKRLQGADGARVVGVGLEEKVDIYDQAVLDSYHKVLSQRDEARESLKVPVKLAQVKSTHTLWQQFRELVFSSLDAGTDISWAGFQPLDGDRRPIFSSVAPIVPIENQRWEPKHPLPSEVLQGKLSTEGAEISFYQDLKQFFDQRSASVDELRERVSAAAMHHSDLDEQLTTLHRELANNGGLRTLDSGEEALITIAEANKLMKEVDAEEGVEQFDLPSALRDYKAKQKEAKDALLAHAELTKCLEETIAQVELQGENLADLASWMEQTQRTFMSKLSLAMNNRLGTIKQDLREAENALEAIKLPEEGTLVKLRKKFHKSLLISSSISFVVALVYHNIHRNVDPATTQDWIHPATFWAFAASVFAALAMGFAADYYRSWSSFDRSITIQLLDMERAVSGHKAAQTELNRLTILYAQAMDWLGIIAKAIKKPWSIRESWKHSSLRALDLEKLPFAMRVAQAQAGEEAPVYILRNAAANTLARRGWRSKSFELLVAEVAKISGKTSAFKVESLDRDLPHAPNGARRLMEEFMGDQKVLERVAARQLKPIIDKLQGEAMSTARPKVLQVDLDPLSPIRVDPESVVEYEPEEEWDEFLTHTLTLGDGAADPQTPLTALVLGDAHIQTGEHEGVASHVLLPQRVASELKLREIGNLVFSPHKESTPAPIDSVVRVDLVGPLDPEITRLLSGEAKSAEQLPEGTATESKLRPGAFD